MIHFKRPSIPARLMPDSEIYRFLGQGTTDTQVDGAEAGSLYPNKIFVSCIAG